MFSLMTMINGLIIDLFLIKAIIYYPLDSKGRQAFRFLSLKRVALLLLMFTLIKQFQFLNILDDNAISILDGIIKITSGKIILTIFIIGLSKLVITNQEDSDKEKIILKVSNILGIKLLLYSNDFILTIISWEIFNKTLYLLVSLNSKNEASLAASLKYFVLSALSTTFFLLGVCKLYKKTGNTNYEIIETNLIELNNDNKVIMGFVLILFTLLFKLSAAPFYQWAPDLYENIDNQVANWMIIIPKLAVLSLIKILYDSFSLLLMYQNIKFILLITGIASLFIGTIALNNQWYIKRFFAYSGISHIGYMLLALYKIDMQAYKFYLIVYGISTINIFTIFKILSAKLGRDFKGLTDLKYLWANKILSILFALNIFSLAGKRYIIPA